MRQGKLVWISSVALVVMAWVMWLPWPSGNAHGVQATPGFSTSLEATARWRYTPVPQADLAAVQHREAQLELRRRAYQRAWQIYVMQLHRCRLSTQVNCVSGPQQVLCRDRALAHCLGAAIPGLDAARGALHDQTIALEQAAQRLAGETE